MQIFSPFNKFVSLGAIGVIHNFRTGKFMFIDSSNGPVINNLPYKTKVKMFECGMIIEESQDEINELLEERKTILQSTDAMVLRIVVSSMCNLNCSYCFQKSIKTRELTPGIVESTIYFLNNRPVPKILDIKWFGGEPLINPKAMKEIYEYILKYVDKNKIDYSSELVTNGTLLSKKNIKIIATMAIDNIQVTIDGTSNIHNNYRQYKNGKGTYKDIMLGLNRLTTEWKGNLIIRSNVSKKNYEDIPKLIDIMSQMPFAEKAIFSFDYMMTNEQSDNVNYFSEKEFSFIQVNLIQYARSKSLSTIPLFPRQRKAMYCLAEADYYSILEPGLNIKKCDLDIGKQIFDEKYQKANTNFWKITDSINNNCMKCQLLPICMGGCKKLGTCPIFSYTIDDRLKLHYKKMLEDKDGNIE